MVKLGKRRALWPWCFGKSARAQALLLAPLLLWNERLSVPRQSRPCTRLSAATTCVEMLAVRLLSQVGLDSFGELQAETLLLLIASLVRKKN